MKEYPPQTFFQTKAQKRAELDKLQEEIAKYDRGIRHLKSKTGRLRHARSQVNKAIRLNEIRSAHCSADSNEAASRASDAASKLRDFHNSEEQASRQFKVEMIALRNLKNNILAQSNSVAQENAALSQAASQFELTNQLAQDVCEAVHLSGFHSFDRYARLFPALQTWMDTERSVLKSVVQNAALEGANEEFLCHMELKSNIQRLMDSLRPYSDEDLKAVNEFNMEQMQRAQEFDDLHVGQLQNRRFPTLILQCEQLAREIALRERLRLNLNARCMELIGDLQKDFDNAVKTADFYGSATLRQCLQQFQLFYEENFSRLSNNSYTTPVEREESERGENNEYNNSSAAGQRHTGTFSHNIAPNQQRTKGWGVGVIGQKEGLSSIYDEVLESARSFHRPFLAHSALLLSGSLPGSLSKHAAASATAASVLAPESSSRSGYMQIGSAQYSNNNDRKLREGGRDGQKYDQKDEEIIPDSVKKQNLFYRLQDGKGCYEAYLRSFCDPSTRFGESHSTRRIYSASRGHGRGSGVANADPDIGTGADINVGSTDRGTGETDKGQSRLRGGGGIVSYVSPNSADYARKNSDSSIFEGNAGINRSAATATAGGGGNDRTIPGASFLNNMEGGNAGKERKRGEGERGEVHKEAENPGLDSLDSLSLLELESPPTEGFGVQIIDFGRKMKKPPGNGMKTGRIGSAEYRTRTSTSRDLSVLEMRKRIFGESNNVWKWYRRSAQQLVENTASVYPLYLPAIDDSCKSDQMTDFSKNKTRKFGKHASSHYPVTQRGSSNAYTAVRTDPSQDGDGSSNKRYNSNNSSSRSSGNAAVNQRLEDLSPSLHKALILPAQGVLPAHVLQNIVQARNERHSQHFKRYEQQRLAEKTQGLLIDKYVLMKAVTNADSERDHQLQLSFEGGGAGGSGRPTMRMGGGSMLASSSSPFSLAAGRRARSVDNLHSGGGSSGGFGGVHRTSTAHTFAVAAAAAAAAAGSTAAAGAGGKGARGSVLLSNTLGSSDAATKSGLNFLLAARLRQGSVLLSGGRRLSNRSPSPVHRTSATPPARGSISTSSASSPRTLIHHRSSVSAAAAAAAAARSGEYPAAATGIAAESGVGDVDRGGVGGAGVGGSAATTAVASLTTVLHRSGSGNTIWQQQQQQFQQLQQQLRRKSSGAASSLLMSIINRTQAVNNNHSSSIINNNSANLSNNGGTGSFDAAKFSAASATAAALEEEYSLQTYALYQQQKHHQIRLLRYADISLHSGLTCRQAVRDLQLIALELSKENISMLTDLLKRAQKQDTTQRNLSATTQLLEHHLRVQRAQQPGQSPPRPSGKNPSRNPSPSSRSARHKSKNGNGAFAGGAEDRRGGGKGREVVSVEKESKIVAEALQRVETFLQQEYERAQSTDNDVFAPPASPAAGLSKSESKHATKDTKIDDCNEKAGFPLAGRLVGDGDEERQSPAAESKPASDISIAISQLSSDDHKKSGSATDKEQRGSGEGSAVGNRSGRTERGMDPMLSLASYNFASKEALPVDYERMATSADSTSRASAARTARNKTTTTTDRTQDARDDAVVLAYPAGNGVSSSAAAGLAAHPVETPHQTLSAASGKRGGGGGAPTVAAAAVSVGVDLGVGHHSFSLRHNADTTLSTNNKYYNGLNLGAVDARGQFTDYGVVGDDGAGGSGDVRIDTERVKQMNDRLSLSFQQARAALQQWIAHSAQCRYKDSILALAETVDVLKDTVEFNDGTDGKLIPNRAENFVKRSYYTSNFGTEGYSSASGGGSSGISASETEYEKERGQREGMSGEQRESLNHRVQSPSRQTFQRKQRLTVAASRLYDILLDSDETNNNNNNNSGNSAHGELIQSGRRKKLRAAAGVSYSQGNYNTNTAAGGVVRSDAQFKRRVDIEQSAEQAVTEVSLLKEEISMLLEKTARFTTSAGDSAAAAVTPAAIIVAGDGGGRGGRGTSAGGRRLPSPYRSQNMIGRLAATRQSESNKEKDPERDRQGSLRQQDNEETCDVLNYDSVGSGTGSESEGAGEGVKKERRRGDSGLEGSGYSSSSYSPRERGSALEESGSEMDTRAVGRKQRMVTVKALKKGSMGNNNKKRKKKRKKNKINSGVAVNYTLNLRSRGTSSRPPSATLRLGSGSGARSGGTATAIGRASDKNGQKGSAKERGKEEIKARGGGGGEASSEGVVDVSHFLIQSIKNNLDSYSEWSGITHSLELEGGAMESERGRINETLAKKKLRGRSSPDRNGEASIGSNKDSITESDSDSDSSSSSSGSSYGERWYKRQQKRIERERRRKLRLKKQKKGKDGERDEEEEDDDDDDDDEEFVSIMETLYGVRTNTAYKYRRRSEALAMQMQGVTENSSNFTGNGAVKKREHRTAPHKQQQQQQQHIQDIDSADYEEDAAAVLDAFHHTNEFSEHKREFILKSSVPFVDNAAVTAGEEPSQLSDPDASDNENNENSNKNIHITNPGKDLDEAVRSIHSVSSSNSSSTTLSSVQKLFPLATHAHAHAHAHTYTQSRSPSFSPEFATTAGAISAAAGAIGGGVVGIRKGRGGTDGSFLAGAAAGSKNTPQFPISMPAGGFNSRGSVAFGTGGGGRRSMRYESVSIPQKETMLVAVESIISGELFLIEFWWMPKERNLLMAAKSFVGKSLYKEYRVVLSDQIISDITKTPRNLSINLIFSRDYTAASSSSSYSNNTISNNSTAAGPHSFSTDGRKHSSAASDTGSAAGNGQHNRLFHMLVSSLKLERIANKHYDELVKSVKRQHDKRVLRERVLAAEKLADTHRLERMRKIEEAEASGVATAAASGTRVPFSIDSNSSNNNNNNNNNSSSIVPSRGVRDGLLQQQQEQLKSTSTRRPFFRKKPIHPPAYTPSSGSSDAHDTSTNSSGAAATVGRVEKEMEEEKAEKEKETMSELEKMQLLLPDIPTSRIEALFAPPPANAIVTTSVGGAAGKETAFYLGSGKGTAGVVSRGRKGGGGAMLGALDSGAGKRVYKSQYRVGSDLASGGVRLHSGQQHGENADDDGDDGDDDDDDEDKDSEEDLAVRDGEKAEAKRETKRDGERGRVSRASTTTASNRSAEQQQQQQQQLLQKRSIKATPPLSNPPTSTAGVKRGSDIGGDNVSSQSSASSSPRAKRAVLSADKNNSSSNNNNNNNNNTTTSTSAGNVNLEESQGSQLSAVTKASGMSGDSFSSASASASGSVLQRAETKKQQSNTKHSGSSAYSQSSSPSQSQSQSESMSESQSSQRESSRGSTGTGFSTSTDSSLTFTTQSLVGLGLPRKEIELQRRLQTERDAVKHSENNSNNHNNSASSLVIIKEREGGVEETLERGLYGKNEKEREHEAEAERVHVLRVKRERERQRVIERERDFGHLLQVMTVRRKETGELLAHGFAALKNMKFASEYTHIHHGEGGHTHR